MPAGNFIPTCPSATQRGRIAARLYENSSDRMTEQAGNCRRRPVKREKNLLNHGRREESGESLEMKGFHLVSAAWKRVTFLRLEMRTFC